MSASPFETKQKTYLKIAWRYLLVTILCALFGAVYELFSHDVYAYGMLYGFMFPLIGGLLPALLWARSDKSLSSETSRQLWHFGISSLTVGSLFSGALSIYGTESHLTAFYWSSGGLCLLLSLLTMAFLPAKSEDSAEEKAVMQTKM